MTQLDGHHSSDANDQEKALPPFDAASLLAAGQQSLVRVRTDADAQGLYYSGSGVFVKSGIPGVCEAATVSHVTDGALETNITAPDGRTYRAQAELIDRKHEIAIYKLAGVRDPDALCKAPPLRVTEVRPNELVLGLSAVLGPFLPTPLIGQHLGDMKRNDPNFNWDPLPEEDLQRSMGRYIMRALGRDSGGPTFDAAGNVVGLIAGSTDQGFTLTEQAKYLQDDLDEIKRSAEK
jgi:hypothetical protein